MRRFRFGVVGESISEAAALAGCARRAEDLGYATLLLRDHFVAEPFGHQFAPLIALTAAAAATTTLRVGTLVLANDYRHPVNLAKEAATLDVLSGGRFELGLGAGWLRSEYMTAGMSFDAPGERVGRLGESIRLLKALFNGTPVTFNGDHYHIAELDSFPRPAQRSHPPLLIGAGSPRMLRLAGQEADIVGILPKALPNGTISEELSERTPAAVAQKVAWIREGAGDRFDQIELSMMVSPLISNDAEAAAGQFASERGWGVTSDRVHQMPSAFVGSVERIVDLMQAGARSTASRTTSFPTARWTRSHRWWENWPAPEPAKNVPRRLLRRHGLRRRRKANSYRLRTGIGDHVVARLVPPPMKEGTCVGQQRPLWLRRQQRWFSGRGRRRRFHHKRSH